MEPILHITSRPEWQAAIQLGAYITPSLASQGFIHCSFARQVERVANKFYAGQPDLVILVIDPLGLNSPLKIETAVDVMDDFPHIYGPLNLDAVVKVVDFRLSSDQQFHLPVELAGNA
jgi:uncharacterized protein (DUF952 family)